MKYAKIIASAAMALMSCLTLSAQDHFWFDEGGIVTPAEGTVDKLDKIIIDYSGCQGTANGLNLGNGKGKDWITGSDAHYSVTLTDDYTNHRLTLTVADGPLVKGDSYKLTIPEGAINVYGNPDLVNEAVSYWWTVDGSLDTGAPQGLTIVSSYPAEGQVIALPVEELTLTFDQDVTVRHSAFDAAGRITNLTSGGFIQLQMKAEGNTISLTKGSYSSSDFMAGQQYELELYANHIFSANDPGLTLPNTNIAFSIMAEGDASGLQVMTQIPAAGENIRNAGSVKFNMNLTAVDGEKISLVNELGHVAELSTVGVDGQSPKSLIFNIDPSAHLQGNTTYKLHLQAGAITAGEYTNEEMDAAYWCIPQEMFTLDCDLANTAVASFSQIRITANTDAYISISDDDLYVKVTGVSTNADHIYSNFLEISVTEGWDITISFEQEITPELLSQGGALYNSVKVVIAEGTFVDAEGRKSRQAEFVIYVIEDKVIGEQTWTFSPTSGSVVERLGTPWFAEDEEGHRITYYNISFEVKGENVYARIPDGTLLQFIDTATNSQVRTFGRNDLTGYNNRFTLELGEEAVTEPSTYQLVIPAEAINLYSDAGCHTTPIHPSADVVASWTVGDEAALETLHTDASTSEAYDLMGRRVPATTAQPQFIIRNGKLTSGK